MSSNCIIFLYLALEKRICHRKVLIVIQFLITMVIRIIEIEIETETETIYPKEKVIGGTILLIQEIGKKTGELFISFEKKKTNVLQ